MTAPFVAQLCGYRESGNPNTSDNNDKQSISWGHALFEQLGVASDAIGPSDVGRAMESTVAAHLADVRPDLFVGSSQQALTFDQYAHLAVFRNFSRAYKDPGVVLEDGVASLLTGEKDREKRALLRAIRKAAIAVRLNHDLVDDLTEAMPEESLLKVDVTVAEEHEPHPRLLVALSSKWSLRTDRAQDCISQGSKLANLRRGRMPHYAVLTMEPRPAMLRLIAFGSGAVDCLYHLALPELRRAAQALEQSRGRGPWSVRSNLERMVSQGRLRDYDDLVAEVERLPRLAGGPDDL